MFKALVAANESLANKTAKGNREKVLELIKRITVDHLGVSVAKITEHSHFVEDLGANSLELVELHMAFEEEFGCSVSDADAEKLTTVGSVVEYVMKHAKTGAKETITLKAGESKYGTEANNHFADPGLQPDGKPRYPLAKDGELNEERIRAAWNYLHHSKDAAKYTPEQLEQIKKRIIAAWKEKISKEGPPSAKQ